MVSFTRAKMKYLKKLTNRLTDFLTYSKINNMEQTIYDVDYFIRKFSEIPEENWYAGSYCHPNIEAYCALGHCGERYSNASIISGTVERTGESSALRSLVGKILGLDIVDINDTIYNPSYQQPTPKQRVLAALYDIKRAKYPEISEPPVYVEDLIGEPTHSTHP
jgi:hypothetical protein